MEKQTKRFMWDVDWPRVKMEPVTVTAVCERGKWYASAHTLNAHAQRTAVGETAEKAFIQWGEMNGAREIKS